MNPFIPKDPFETEVNSNLEVPIPFASFADFEVEFELIGSILKKGSIFEDVASEIHLDTFHNDICQDIFSAMQKLREVELVLDVITVGDQLDRDGTLSTILYHGFSGRAALGRIREQGNPKNVSSYVEIVKDYWAKRCIDEISQALVTQSRNGRRAVDILADARVKFDALSIDGGQGPSRTHTASTLASILYDHVDEAAQGNLKGCPTGLIDLDRIVTMLSGDIILIGGRPGQGKSALLISIALQAAQKYQKRVGLFSLEMSGKQVSARITSQLSGIPSDRILKAQLAPNEWPPFTQAVETLEHLPLMINDRGGISVSQMRTETRRMARQLGGLDLIIVDYVQLMKPARHNKNRNEDIGEAMKGLKELGKEFDVPILAAAQMNRGVEARSDKRPILSDLRESGDLENDSDVVMFLYEPDGKSGVRELIIAKHRNGPVGVIELTFRGALTKFENCTIKKFDPDKKWQDREDM